MQIHSLVKPNFSFGKTPDIAKILEEQTTSIPVRNPKNAFGSYDFDVQTALWNTISDSLKRVESSEIKKGYEFFGNHVREFNLINFTNPYRRIITSNVQATRNGVNEFLLSQLEKYENPTSFSFHSKENGFDYEVSIFYDKSLNKVVKLKTNMYTKQQRFNAFILKENQNFSDYIKHELKSYGEIYEANITAK